MLLAFFSILSVLFAIVRDRLLAVYVGIGPVLDVYTASFRVPDFLYGLFLAFITAGTIVPFLTKENKNGDIIESEKRFSSVLFFFSLAMSSFVVILFFTIPFFAKFIVPGFNQEQIDSFIFVTRILLVQPLILGVSSLISCFAQLKNEFIYYGIAPLGYSLGIILSIVFLYERLGLYGLAIGVAFGAFVSLVIQTLSLRKHKFSIRKNHFDWKHIRELAFLALPRSTTNVITQFRVLFLTAFATTLGPGVLSSFLFAQKITDAFSQIISQSVGTASLPTLSREYEENRIMEHENLVYKYTKFLFLIAIPISITAYFFRDLIVVILYDNSGANELIATFLIGFLITLPFSMASSYLVVGFYSMKRTGKVFIGNLIATVVMIPVCLYFKDKGVYSLIYGIVSYSIISSVIYLFFYKRNGLLKNNS